MCTPRRHPDHLISTVISTGDSFHCDSMPSASYITKEQWPSQTKAKCNPLYTWLYSTQHYLFNHNVGSVKKWLSKVCNHIPNGPVNRVFALITIVGPGLASLSISDRCSARSVAWPPSGGSPSIRRKSDVKPDSGGGGGRSSNTKAVCRLRLLRCAPPTAANPHR